MKKLTLAIAALAAMTTSAIAAHHTGHDSSPPMNVVRTDKIVKYDKTTTNDMGTTQEGSMKHTQTTAKHGTKVISESSYHHHTPSAKAKAMEADKKMELSLGVGGAYSFAKDNADVRMSDMGLSGGVQMMWHMNKYLALGLDYTMMAPQAHSDSRNGGYNYSKLRAHHMDLAGKLTFANWHKMSFYSPMGIGMSNIELKGSGARDGLPVSESKDKWGMNFYLGLGMQYDLTNDLFVGLEYRYYMPFIKTDDLSRYGKDRYMDFHNVGLRMGMRF